MKWGRWQMAVRIDVFLDGWQAEYGGTAGLSAIHGNGRCQFINDPDGRALQVGKTERCNSRTIGCYSSGDRSAPGVLWCQDRINLGRIRRGQRIRSRALRCSGIRSHCTHAVFSRIQRIVVIGIFRAISGRRCTGSSRTKGHRLQAQSNHRIGHRIVICIGHMHGVVLNIESTVGGLPKHRGRTKRY